VVHKIDKSLLYTQPSGLFDQEIETFLSQIDSTKSGKIFLVMGYFKGFVFQVQFLVCGTLKTQKHKIWYRIMSCMR